MDPDPTAAPLTIAAGQAVSDPIDFELDRVHRLEMPAAWDAASITFLVSRDGQVFQSLYLDTAEYVVSAAGANRSIVLDPSIFIDVRHLKVRSGTSAAPINQTAERIIQAVTYAR